MDILGAQPLRRIGRVDRGIAAADHDHPPATVKIVRCFIALNETQRVDHSRGLFARDARAAPWRQAHAPGRRMRTPAPSLRAITAVRLPPAGIPRRASAPGPPRAGCRRRAACIPPRHRYSVRRAAAGCRRSSPRDRAARNSAAQASDAGPPPTQATATGWAIRLAAGRPPTGIVKTVHGIALQPPDLDGLPVVPLHHAVAFAQHVHRAHSRATQSENVGIENGQRGAAQIAARYLLDKARHIDMRRARRRARRVETEQAAVGLGQSGLRIERRMQIGKPLRMRRAPESPHAPRCHGPLR